MSTTKYDVVVVGAGLIGATFALLLAQRSNLKIGVVERAPELTSNPLPNQRVVALGALATALLAEVGVMSQLGPAQAYPYTKMFVWDENSNGELAFVAGDYGQQALGHLVDSTACNLLLQRELSQQGNVSTHYGFDARQLDIDKAGASLIADSGELKARLLVAADGGDSWVRNQAKIFSHRYSFEQVGIVATIRTRLSHQDTAWQRFLATGPIAVLPLHDNQSSIVWSVDAGYGESLMQLSDEEFCVSVEEAIQNRLGQVELISTRHAFALRSQRADAYFNRSVVLIGDAAHSIHPLAGQGANLGFKDADCLAGIMQSQTGNSLTDAALLRRYQRQRKIDNEQTDWLMHALFRAYRSDNPWWQIVRGKGMNFVGGSQRLKKLLAKQAMGI
ncbi:MAG: FAD-dependent monooxygenase [Arenicella sp.]|nr:FAD-dependent monooxygenase [Arenicella sp.]